MDDQTIIIIIASIVFVLSLVAVVLLRLRKPSKKKPIEGSSIVSCFGKDNILEVSFIRNKLNVTVRDVKNTDMEALKASGAVGINLVGDKIKFYYEVNNEAIYHDIKTYIEGDQ